MTKQEILNEILLLPVHERMGMIANIAMTYIGPEEIMGELLKKDDMRVGIVIATGSNAEHIVELCAKVAQVGAENELEFRSYDLRDQEKKP